MITGCYHCQDRHQGCHSECEKYAEYRKQVDQARQAEHKDSFIRAVFYERSTRRVKHLKSIQGKAFFSHVRKG